MKSIIIVLLCITFSVSAQTDYAKLVNPFIGTGGHGHTYPGVAVPFGMMQLSPDSRLAGWDGCSGYHYSDDYIYGFSHTHLSGTGVSDYGDLLIFPFTGDNKWNNSYRKEKDKGYGSKFSHEDEEAHAGYYRVRLEDLDINCEFTTTTRCGYHKYFYPENTNRKIIIDLEHRDKMIDSDLMFLNDSTVVGKRISDNWATEQHFYFAIKFSEIPKERYFKKNDKNMSSKLILEFGDDFKVLGIKVGMSAVDINGAVKNLNTEMPHWDFATYQKANEDMWNKELGKIHAQDKDQDKLTIFYTSLYHTYLCPNVFSDVDGRFRGMDMQIHQSNDHVQYTVFSLWDTFRATHPLYTITQRKRSVDFIKTMLSQYHQGGILPIWELSANYTGCMIGNHSIPVIVDAYNKGIRDFDQYDALKAMVHSADQDRLGLEHYKKQGFISSENESESVSKTLEYAYDDWCIAIFADSLHDHKIADRFYERSQFYKNLYNPKTAFMQPRFNGGWKNNFKPNEVNFDYTEANSWQYSLFVPHDILGLIQLMGGKDRFEAWLDELFTTSSETIGRSQVDITGMIGQYAHGNEPSHHMAYLYNFTNHQWKTQKYVNQIMTTLYHNDPDGLSGNEDCGQMSAWYAFSAMGIYPITPGTDQYALGTPHLSSFSLKLENGNTFNIKTENFSNENIYVIDVKLNNKHLARNFIHHHEIMDGGELVFVMSDQPGIFDGGVPYLRVKDAPLMSAPYFDNAEKVFVKKKKVAIKSAEPVVAIRYTTDGEIPTENSLIYSKPIKIKESTNFIAKSFGAESVSYPVYATFFKANSKWRIKLNTNYLNQYSGGSKRALIDQIRGNSDFRTGSWQGYYGNDLNVELDFRKKKEINSIHLSVLQDVKSWIWFPKEVQFYISKNGKKWVLLKTVKNYESPTKYGTFLQEIGFDQAFETRYLKIVAKNYGKCPDWHPGKGNPAYIFADEIIIK
ncbi:GH92 family glycosyl hydrolase [Paracrocinitomix mangrovi]|uniref:GH92 family glycosyl hydrolase n=1 Tax=Paracrocinitomix mangrovi TaxID=2862509 RepID=UPI001C8ECFDF|nr:GH92 family glycosyl hydrolase [Paracrocinitomix mangrovi]UKN02074.1 GH92 family glycosyl hydrolase [Paracrocinitomix mangrovi]